MRAVVVDTNIVFSALLNTSGTIGDLLFNSERVFQFYSCEHMRAEIEEHWEKLKRISRLSEKELRAAYSLLLHRLTFIDEGSIPALVWLSAEETVADIDPDDADFVALAHHITGAIWTGDKPLYAGLKTIGRPPVYNTAEMLQLREEKET